jgi:acetyl-CoA carboxylase biotin carboxyl carrier protein
MMENDLKLEELTEILQLVEAHGLQEFELEQDGVRVRIVRPASPPVSAGRAVAPSAVPQAQRVTPPPPGGWETGVADEIPVAPDPGLKTVTSPIVGTFYAAADPKSEPFVKVGDRVTVGQVLCIIEAMKLMNEIEAEAVGEVVEVHAQNGQPVQYGDPLFSLRLS